MAGSTSRDVRMTLSVETLGDEGIKALQASIQALANEGGDAAPAFQALADQVGRLGEQGAALAAFQALGDETDQLRAAQTTAAQSAQELDARLQQLRTSTDEARVRQQAAATAFTEGRKAVTDIGTAIRTLQTEYDAAGRQTAEYRARLGALVQAQGEAKNRLLDLSTAQRTANADLSTAETAQRKLETAYERSAETVRQSTTALSTHQKALQQAEEAAQALGLQTDDVAGAQGRLVAALNSAGSSAALIDRELRQAAAATEAVQGAFNALNIRSADDIRADLAGVRQALDTVRTLAASSGQSMAGAFAAGEARVKALELELRQLNGTLTTGDKLSRLFHGSLAQISAGNVIADGVGYLVNKVKELGQAFISSITDGEKFRRGLNAIYKDADTTARQLEFVRTTALNAGVSVGDISGSFIKFSAATRAANIPLQQTNELFAAVTSAAGTLGLSGEEVIGMLEALGQMASKGTVSMEELRQQLGDRLPGALSLVAQGFGITEAALIKLVESGGLASRDLFPALTTALQGMKGEVTGLTPAYENLKTVLTTTAQVAGDAGWTRVLAGGLRGLTAVAGLLASVLLGITNGIGLLGRTAIAVIAPFGSLDERLGFLKESLDEAAASQSKLNGVMDAALNPATTLSSAADAQVQAFGRTARAAEQMSTATAQTAAGLEAQRIAADFARASTDQLSQSYVQQSTRLATLLASAEKQTEASDKQAKAAKVEGDALVALTALRGNERDTLEAAAEAARNNVKAVTEAAAAHQAETEILKAQRQILIERAQRRDGDIKQIGQQVDAITQKIKVSEAETEQATAAAQAARTEALQRDIATKAYGDNSLALATLERAMIAAQATEQVYRQGVKDGLFTQQQATQATEQATEATALYNDALRDSGQKIQDEARLKQANYDISLAMLGVQGQAYERLAAAAKATGNLTQAIYFEIEAKRVQIQITRLTAEMNRAAAAADIEAANAERRRLESSGELTEQKKREIEIRLLNAKAKQIEAGASVEIIKALEAEIDAIRRNANARTTSASGIDSDTRARYKNRDAIEAQTQALEKQRLTGDGFEANRDGSAAGTFNSTLAVDQAFGIVAKKNAGQLTADDLGAAQTAAAQAKAQLTYLQDLQRRSAGSVLPDALRSAEGLVAATRDALDRVQQLIQRNQQQPSRATPSTATVVTPTSSVQPTSHTVTIALGTQRTTINTASPSDSNALVGFLEQLQTAAARTY